jgi:hypothetical protein
MKNFQKPNQHTLKVLILQTVFAITLMGCAESISIRSAPPPLPIYEQPYCPGDGYIWVPGYWAYGPNGYFWVPGIWEMAPEVGWLWTPGYWGWSNDVYIWHSGYWGRHIGFYGGINYGYGYGGVGYEGGYWNNRTFYYNSAVTHVNVTVVQNTYQSAVVENSSTKTVVSYNGGAGGTAAKPLDKELIAAKDPHIAVTPGQKQHVKAAGSNRELLASFNHGHPHPDILAKRQILRKAMKSPKQKKPPKIKGLDNKENEQKPHQEKGSGHL